MDNTIKMYQITKELIIEKDGEGNVESAIIKSENPNNCKYFKKILNSVGIDEEIFKVQEGFAFKNASKGSVKAIIKNHSQYSKLMKQHPRERNIKLLNELTVHIKKILSNEIEDEAYLKSQMAKVELITFNQRQQLNQYLQKLSIPDLSETISAADDEILHFYYIEEMLKLRKKYETIRQIFSEIRNEELINHSLEEVASMSSEKLEKEIYPEKIPLGRLIVKDLLDTKQKKETLIQETLKGLAETLNITEKKLITELRAFRKLGYKNHPLFELSKERDYIDRREFISAYEILQKAIKEYNDNQKSPVIKPALSNEEKEKMEKLLMKFDNLNEEQ
ncbi:hypothetical protein F2Y18_15775 [Bacillus cereus]|uniref:hypothetical protein n=1 Tax=Bacillus cereus TaxID=1396 RepID=UPI00122F72F6|nr:hypothetical protein [Bacillus cereus]KAA2396103.1 hypothetical protein F2Y18_15775 [Bacillus cereus]